MPTALSKGETVTIHITGTAGAAGFRSWLSDDGVGADSDLVTVSGLDGYNKDNIDIKYELVANTAADSVLFKGVSYGKKIDSLVLTSVKVEYSNIKTEYTIPDPFTPEVEQNANASSITLTPGMTYTTGGETKQVDSLIAPWRFTADPTTIEYEGRLYVYGTTDEIEFDGKGNVKKNEYNTHTLSCMSTADMVNWKDEGKIDVTKLTTYAQKSWAPTITSKVINGKTKFFIYYTTGGDGIGVLTADSPTGPWSDPLGQRIIDRSTPNCTEEKVPWLFDPGVFVDTDGTAYIYFGGGSNDSMADASHPSSGRIAKLNADMTSLAEEPHEFAPYYYFEDNEINKIGNTYYYSYCTNWSTDQADDGMTSQAGISYYTADNPYMENATYQGTAFANPGSLYGNVYNNHHHMFQFKNKWYISYHTTYLENYLYGTKMGYRNIHIDPLTVSEDGKLSATASYEGAEQIANFDGLLNTDMSTMSSCGGLTTAYSESLKKMVVTKINTGDWQMLKNVDFKSTDADKITLNIASEKATGAVEVYLDKALTTKVASVPVTVTGGEDKFVKVSANLISKISGVHDLYFVYRGTGYQVADWTLSKTADEIKTPTPTPTPTQITNGKTVKAGGVSYKVTNSAKKEVTFVAPTNKKATTVTIPSTIKVNGIKYKVVTVKANAFAKLKKLKKVVIGTSVKKIEAKAFYKLNALKLVNIKSKVLKSIGTNAFKGINKKAVFTVPAKNKKAYKKLLLKKTGFVSTMKIK